jgi:hypothetical protein
MRIISPLIKAMAAPIAWIMVGLLKGENLTCAMWPTDPNEFPDCVTNSTFALPCQIPKTYETDITTCDAVSFKIQKKCCSFL